MAFLATNAPKHWPQVNVTLHAENYPHNTALIADAFEQAPGAPKVKEFLRRKLHQKGIAQIHMVVEDRGREIPVFVFGTASPENGQAFSWYHKWAKAHGYPTAIYYAPAPLKPGPANPQYLAFSWDFFYKANDPGGLSYAWWPTPQEPKWTGSSVQRSMHRAFTAISGFESGMFGLFVEGIGMETGGPVALPEDDFVLPVTGPEGKEFYVSVSREKGIQMHFNPAYVSGDFRDKIWKLYADYCELIGKLWKLNAKPINDGLCLHWFQYMNQDLQQKELNGNIKGVSGILNQE